MMKVTRASDVHKDIIRQHWHQIFTKEQVGDIDYYFDELYDAQNCIVLVENNQVLASCQIHPYQMMCHDRIIETSLLHGFYTIEERRHEGLMKHLIHRVLMEREYLELLTLVAGDVEMDMTPFNFEPVFYQQVYTIRRSMIPIMDSTGVRLNIADSELLELYQYYTKYFNGYFIRNESYYEQMKQTLRHNDGRYVGVYDTQGDLRASIRLKVKNQEAQVDELIYKDTASILKLLSFVLSQFQTIVLHVSLAEDIQKIVPEALVIKEISLYARLNQPSLFERLYKVKVKTSDSALNAFQRPLFNSEKS